MNYHLRIGLKLYSTDTTLIENALRIQEEGFFDYIELYIVPGSYEKTIECWKSFNCPFVIHAPHSIHGFNLAQAEKWEINYQNFYHSKLFSDTFNSDIIIVHGGNNGSFNETIRQIKLLNENKIVLENKPKVGLQNEQCVGCTPSEFHLASEAGILHGTVLDFVHAVCTANSLGIDKMEIIRDFMVFNPKIFHIADGYTSSEKDIHLNLGKGNLNLAEFLSVIPHGGLVTIETPHDKFRGLEDFVNNVNFLRNLLSKENKSVKI